MIRKKIIHKNIIGLCLFVGIQSVANAEYRCGWLDNPIEGIYQLTDKSASWVIMDRTMHKVSDASMKNLPTQLESEYVRLNDRFGYSCVCMSVTTDSRTNRITSIVHKGKQMLLKKCLEDKTIMSREDIEAQLSKLQYSQRAINPSEDLLQPSGSYIDTPVIAGRPNADPKGYYDEPKISQKTTTINAVTSTKARAKTHYIQVIVTSMPEKAKRLKNSYDKAGFKTIVSKVKRKDKSLHRVRIGPYTSRKAALDSHKRLREVFKKDQAVQKSVIVG